RFDASPKRRPVECGMPGKEHAIHDVDTTAPAQRGTYQLAYDVDERSEGSPPAGQLRRTTLTDPRKTKTRCVTTAGGDRVATSVVGSGESVLGQSSATPTYAAPGGEPAHRAALVHLPNSFVDDPGSSPASYVATMITDTLGRLVRWTDPS